jgi:hypothetical protein
MTTKYFCKGCGAPLGTYCAKAEYKINPKNNTSEMIVEIHKTDTLDLADNYYCFPPKDCLGRINGK